MRRMTAREGSATATPGRVGMLLSVLGLGLAVNAVLGPLALGVIDYRFSPSLVYQGIGLDSVSLFLVAPLALVAGWLTRRQRVLGPVLGTGVGAYSAYMAIQYVVGPEYVSLPGDNERFFLLHLVLFVLGLAACAGAWARVDPRRVPPDAGPAARRWGGLLIALGFLLLLRYLPALAELTAGDPSLPEFRENPTSFLLIALLDLGVFAPAALLFGTGLRRGRRWAVKGLHLVVGWIALVGLAVGAMAVVMWLQGSRPPRRVTPARSCSSVWPSRPSTPTWSGRWWAEPAEGARSRAPHGAG